MLTLESAIEKIQQLPPEQQKQVFKLIEDLEKQTQNKEKTFIEVASKRLIRAIGQNNKTLKP